MEADKELINTHLKSSKAPRYTLRKCNSKEHGEHLKLSFNERDISEKEAVKIWSSIPDTESSLILSWRYTNDKGLPKSKIHDFY
jgi:hypothetical protein